MHGELTMNSLPCTMSVSIRRTSEVNTAWVKSRVTRHSCVRSSMRGYRPAPLPYVPAAVSLDHEYVFAFACGHDRQIDGEPGPARQASGLRSRSPAGCRVPRHSVVVTGGDAQRIHDAVAIHVPCLQAGQGIRHGPKTLRLSPGLSRSSTGSLKRTAPSAGQERVLGQQGARHLRRHRVRRAAVRLGQQVRQPHRLAELYGPLESDNVVQRRDFKLLLRRTEVRSAHGGSTWDTYSMIGPGKPEACAIASTPPPSASSRSVTWNARGTVPAARSSNRQTTLAVHHDDREGNPRRRPLRRVKHHHRTDVNQSVHCERDQSTRPANFPRADTGVAGTLHIM